MAKDKHQRIKEEKTPATKEKETIMALIGLILVVFSLLVIANTGIVANALKYACIFLFGTCYIFVLLTLIIVGSYMIIKKKSLKLFGKIQYVLLFGCFICILALSSFGKNVTVSNFSNVYKTLMPKSIYQTKEIVGSYGGGWIGYLLIAIFNTLLGSEAWSLVIYILVLLGLIYLIFHKQVAKLYRRIITKHNAKKQIKSENDRPENNRESENDGPLPEQSNHSFLIQDEEVQPQGQSQPIVEEVMTQPQKTLTKETYAFKKLSDFESVIDDLNETRLFARPNLNGNKAVVEPTPVVQQQPSFTFHQPEEVKQDPVQQNLFVQDEVNVQPNPAEVIQEPVSSEDENYLRLQREYEEFIKETRTPVAQQPVEQAIIDEVAKPVESFTPSFMSEQPTEQSQPSEPSLSEPESKQPAVANHIFEYHYQSSREEVTKKESLDDNVEEPIQEDATNETTGPAQSGQEKPPFDPETYKLPPLYLLKDSSSMQETIMKNEAKARANADILSQKMEELNVRAKITNYAIGPSVTQYEIMLEPGVRANAFLNLQEDFKLALGATSLRIESPIPGKAATIGIEVPNEVRGMVTLKELMLALPKKKANLFVPAGKGISGDPISIAIVKMPHCLISGATNSGKSVCANSIICSLLLNYKPNEVKMIMVDPKRVEMLFYTNLPHLMCPIITESSKAVVALDKLTKEMMNRFDIFAKIGAKNIEVYNEMQVQQGKPIMPFIVLVVDEFAELMSCKQSSIVEEKIQSLVQLGRAAGVHLILCTQRPSVNVITGTIKNNIPCRMTFRLSSFADSKTVIDGSGAEKLLNNGDMLLLTPDFTGLRRIQGAYVSDKEIDDIVEFCKKQCAPQYDPNFMDLRTDEEKENDLHTMFNSGNNKEEDNGYNAKYLDVRNFVLSSKKASTSLIQRKFQIGYGKAANFMDMLEDEGIVGPENGSKGREVLMTLEEWESKNG